MAQGLTIARYQHEGKGRQTQSQCPSKFHIMGFLCQRKPFRQIHALVFVSASSHMNTHQFITKQIESKNKMSTVAFVSRVIHLISGALLFAHAWAPLIPQTLAPQGFLPRGPTIPVLAFLSLAAGLFNAMRAAPSRFPSTAGSYRMAVYSKIPLLFVFTPTFASLTGDLFIPLRAIAVLLMTVLGTRGRFVREAATLKQ